MFATMFPKMCSVALISLFLSLSPSNCEETEVSTEVARTGGYMDPFSTSNQRQQIELTSDGPRLWEKLLVNSTETVTLLAHMVAFSTRVPVSLASYPPEGGWKRVQFPNSLRASIVQLGNQVWDSVNQAAVNLDEVQLRMKTVPSNIRMSLRVLRKMKLEMIPKLLPVYLGAIENAGAKSVELASSTVHLFTETAELIKELQTGVFSTQDGRKQELREERKKAEMLKVLQEKFEEIVAFNKDVYKKNENRVNEASRKFYKAMKKLPSGWKAVLKDVVKAASCAALTYINPALGAAYTTALYKNSKDGGSVQGIQAAVDATKKKLAFTNDDVIVMQSVAEYPDALGNLVEIIDAGKVGEKFEEFDTMRTRMEEMMKTWSKDFKKSKVRQRVESAMKEISSMCQRIAESFKNAECLAKGSQRAKRDAPVCVTAEQLGQFKQQLVAAQKVFMTVASAKTNYESAMMQSPPRVSQKGGVKNGQFKVIQARLHLQNLLRIQQMAQDKVTKSIENLGRLNMRLKGIDLTTVNLELVIKLLNQMAESLTDMIQIWRNLQHFFYNVQKHARVLKDSSRKYAELGRKHTEIAGSGAGDEQYRREMVYQMLMEAKQVNAHSSMVFTMSKTYVDVANDHLLTPLGRVTEMFTVTDLQEVVRLRNEISDSVEGSKAEERRFNEMSQKQMANYNTLLDQYGGESEEMNQIVAEGQEMANEVGEEAEDNELTDWGAKRK